MSKDILSEMTNYLTLLDMYEQNKDKSWKDWLELDTETENKTGKQGMVGVFKIKNTNEKVRYKISQYINYLIRHEYDVMDGLKNMALYCPHFCKSIGIIKCNIDPRDMKCYNPFDIQQTKYPIRKEILLMENIDNSYKFCNYIKNINFPEIKLYSIIKQVLMATFMAQNKKFSHYDLHSDNVMIKKCNKDLVFLYVLDDMNQFAVPTMGYYPIIIDFGFSYIENMEDKPLWASMGHTDIGFTSDRFDWIADPKLFLVTVSEEIYGLRHSKTSKKFYRIIKNIFRSLNISWDSGWDNDDEICAAGYISRLLENESKISPLFDKYDHYCLDILQTLIYLPLESQNYDNISSSYTSFLEEFNKIELEIGDPFYNLYILQNIVDLARTIRPYYLDNNTRQGSLRIFREELYHKLNDVAKFCRPKNIKYEKMLVSLYVFSKCMEGVLFEVINKKMKNKQIEYDKLPLKNIAQIYGVIETNIPDDYIYTDKTTIVMLDCRKKIAVPFCLNPFDLNLINNTHQLSRGTLLFDLYKNEIKSVI